MQKKTDDKKMNTFLMATSLTLSRRLSAGKVILEVTSCDPAIGLTCVACNLIRNTDPAI